MLDRPSSYRAVHHDPFDPFSARMCSSESWDLDNSQLWKIEYAQHIRKHSQGSLPISTNGNLYPRVLQ